jgi:toxin ParE1/3/4
MTTFSISLTQKSEQEFIDAVVYYETQQPGLGVRFQNAINKLLLSICKNPFAYQRKYKHYREAISKPFPYIVVYEISGAEIVVLAIFHAKQNPKKKLNRKSNLK